MAGGVINLGQVAFVDKDVYSSSVTYKRFNFIVTDDSCYLSLKDGNIGHALTDTSWWKCIANGKQATEAAKKALLEATRASNAADNLIGAATTAEQAATRANVSANDADIAKAAAEQATIRADTISGEASKKIVEMDALSKAVAGYINAAPVRMLVSVPVSISTKNKLRQKINITLFPSYCLKNALYQRISGSSVDADPSGNLTVLGTGKSTFYVIPTQNTELWQKVDVTIRTPLIRLTGNGKIRLNGGKIRIV
jgi:hypothetical protein|nr:MAG TPA: hypothetical protein [Caudoviricetes sp.]